MLEDKNEQIENAENAVDNELAAELREQLEQLKRETVELREKLDFTKAEKKRNEIAANHLKQKIKELEDQSGEVTNLLPQALFFLNPQGKILSVNTAAEKMFALAAGSFEGKRLHELEVKWYDDQGNEGVTAAEKKFAHLLDPHGGAVAALGIIAAAGRGTWLRFQSVPMRNGNGPKGRLVTVSDISEQRRLKQEAKMLSGILGQISDLVAVTDKELNVQYINRAFETVTGYGRNDIVGKKLTLFSGDEEAAAAIEAMKEQLLTGKVQQQTLSKKKKDGVCFEEEVTATPFIDASGKVSHFIFCGRDTGVQGDEEEEEKKNLKEIFELQGAVNLIIDPDSGEILDANYQAVQFYGYPRSELVGMNISSINSMNPEEIAAARKEAAELKRNYFAFKHRLANGETRDVEVYSNPMEYGGRKVLYSIIHDVTDKVKAEEAISEADARFQTVSALVSDYAFSLLVKDHELRVDWVTGDFKKNTGFAFAALIDDPGWKELVHQDDRDAYAGLLAMIKAGEEAELEFRIVTRDGSLRWLRTVSQPAEKAQGNERRCLGAVRDITESKETEDAVREGEKKFRELFNHLASAFALFELEMDEDGTPVDYRVLETNKAFEKFVGAIDEDLSGKTGPELFSDPELVNLEKYAKVALEGVPERFDVYSKKLDKYYSVLAYSPETRRFAALFDDISERVKTGETLKDSGQRLKELNAQKEKLFSIVAHDLRTPFFGLTGLSEYLATSADTLSKDRVKSIASRLYVDAKNITRLIDNLMQWSRFTTGNMNFNPVRLHLNDMIEKLFEYFGNVAIRKEIGLRKKLEDDHYVLGDMFMIETVLRNLMSNALKFTETEGSVEVSAVKIGEEVIVQVKDSGVGMEPEIMKNLFKTDKTFSTTGTDGEKGTGLGLLLCKEFVEKNDGRIVVESVKGKGTTFTVTLPAVK